jgi:predicted enzyme related to lactoylglutathione lyase
VSAEGAAMIHGVHFLLYSRDADADRRFLSDVLGFPGVDAGEGWLIFALPPAELAVHPAGENFAQRHAGHELMGAVLYLMCDDLHTTLESLAAKGVSATEIQTEAWGVRTTIRLPSGGELGLYQPAHPSPLGR